MLSKTLEEALNEQVNSEYYSAFLYLSMSSYFETVNLLGMAKWMRMQYEEEIMHAIKIFDMIVDMEGTVNLKAVDGPPTEFKSPLDVFEKSLAHERKVTGMINDIYSLAQKENDYAVQSALQWFIDEQVEEEKSALEVVRQLEMIGDETTPLLMLDSKLGSRELRPEE
ncbi:MAG: ferritin [Candidatus Marinimicrobia bacterium]|nr:ferritin [Candidatus Neomarinimicrobiota bacterium]